MSEERLQKIISTAGVASRRAAEELITQGRVEVNGKPVRTLGTKADLARDEIEVDGRRIRAQNRTRYILLYKPRGYVTTRSDPQGRPTVMDLLKGVKEYVYPVGRLDYDSEGLLLLTNDGDLAARLMHPSHEIEKVYEARVRGVPAPEDLERLAKGIVLDGRRTVDVGGDHQRPIPARTQMQRQLGALRRLAGTLQANEHDDRRILGRTIERRRLRAKQGNKLVVDDFDDLLDRRHTLEDFGADGAFTNVADELTHDFVIDVRLQQSEAHLAHRIVEILFGDRPVTIEFAED